MCPGVDSASKNEYQDVPGCKDGRCIRVTTLPPSQCRKSRKSGALTYQIPKGLLAITCAYEPCIGQFVSIAFYRAKRLNTTHVLYCCSLLYGIYRVNGPSRPKTWRLIYHVHRTFDTLKYAIVRATLCLTLFYGQRTNLSE
jgi:hypothetical protein